MSRYVRAPLAGATYFFTVNLHDRGARHLVDHVVDLRASVAERFWEHQIRDASDFEKHVEYIHFNPVKHGWVLRAKDWPYSSLHRYARVSSAQIGASVRRSMAGSGNECRGSGCRRSPRPTDAAPP